MQSGPSRRHGAAIAVIALAITLATCATGAPRAQAAVMDADRVGGVAVSSSPSLRRSAPDLYIPAGTLSTMDGRELWSRDASAKRAMASTTKIMTAIIVLEHGNLSDMVTVDKQTAMVGQSSMGLVQGERLTEGELLKGVLVQSGNDAATLIAKHVGGSVSSFVALMNAKARALDLLNTHYVTPHGLDTPGHYTSAADLTSLARYAMRSPVFRSIVKTYTVKVRSDRYTHVLLSHNSLLQTYRGAEGIKTGWTNNAGYCVVFAAQRDGVELVGTVMGAASESGRAQEAKTLFDWGFSHYRRTVIATAGDPVGRVKVSDYLERTVSARTAETTSIPVFDLAGPVRRRVELASAVPAPVTAGERIGTMTVYQGETVIAQLPVVAGADVPAPSVWQRVVFFFGGIWRGVFGH